MYNYRLMSACLISIASLIDFSTATIQPVLSVDFPDPCMIGVDNTYYAFATSSTEGKHIQVAATSDFVKHDWRLVGNDPLPDPGAWAVNDNNIWGPDVIELEDGTFVMYYAAISVQDRTKHCIGAATSRNVLGPYTPSKAPLACPLLQGGAIDPSGFVDPQSGNHYVVYKVDGNSLDAAGQSCGASGTTGYQPTPIMLQQVAKDGVTPIGQPWEISNRDSSDGPLVEAPSLFYNAASKMYLLTYSSNCYSTTNYNIEWAYSSSLSTVFMKSSSPLMDTGTGLVTAPGGADVSADGRYAVFHGTVGWRNNGEPIRYMYAMEMQGAGQHLAIAETL